MGRALGVLLAVAAGSACYSPELRDCTVSCATADDCAGDQVCGRDRLCAMPTVADHCAALSVADAGTSIPGDAGTAVDAGSLPRDAGGSPPRDAAIDAPPPPPTQIVLRVQIAGKGTVVVDGHGMCAGQGPQHGDCTFMVAPRVGVALHALPDLGQKFSAWTSTTCKGQGATCTFTPTVAVTVNAAFSKNGGGGGDDEP